MLYTSDLTMPTSVLRQHLADATIAPAEMYELAKVYDADPETIDVLCEHATGSFSRLVGLCAARVRDPTYLLEPEHRARFHAQVFTCVTGQCRNASEADLLEGLHTARTVFGVSAAPSLRELPLAVSDLFAGHAPDAALTDNVAAEMSARFTDQLSPESAIALVTGGTHRLVSRYLLSRFGTHAPSWDMFKQLHTVDASTVDIVDLVVAVEQKR